MRKEIEFLTKFDTSEFDKAVEVMQRKLREVYRPSDIAGAQRQTAQRLENLGLGGNLSKPTMEAFQKSMNQSRRDMDKIISDEAKNQEKLAKDIAKRAEALNKMRASQKEMLAGSKEELEIKEKISRVEENQYKLRENYKQRDQALNKALQAREEMNTGVMDQLRQAHRQGGMRGLLSAATGLLGGATGIAGGIAGIGTAMNVASSFGDRLAGFDMRLEQARGSAVAATTGQDLSRVYAGKSPFESAFLPERSAAAGLAEEKKNSNRFFDRTKGIGSVLGMAGGAGLMLGGLGVGAASLAGMPFTAGGSALGLGAAGGMMTGGAAMFGAGFSGLSNDRNRKGILGGKEYEQLLASQQSKDFREALESLKEQDPAKKLSIENFEQNYLKNVQLQRSLGITNKQFYGEGGFQQRGAQAGFLPEQMAGMAQGIVGAGGSARMGRNAEFGLQMERGGLTNASSVLGTLSGGIQSPESSKRAVIGIISEAFQIGLDNTDFAEEQRRFSQAASGIIARTGTASEEGQALIAQTLGMFLGDRTNQGVQAAQGAYEKFQERGSQLGGRRGAMRLSDALQDASLSKIPTNELTELLGMRPEELREDSDVVQYFAQQAGISPKQLIEKVSKGNMKSRFLIPGSQEKVGGFQSVVSKFMEERGVGYSEMEEMQKNGMLPPEVSSALGGLKVRAQMEEKGGVTSVDSAAMAGEFFPGAKGGRTGQFGKSSAEGMLGPTGRLEDQVTAAGAAGADKAREQFVLLVPELEKAVGAARKFAEGVTQTADQLHQDANNRRSTLPQGDPMGRDITKAIAPKASIQPQGGKDRK